MHNKFINNKNYKLRGKHEKRANKKNKFQCLLLPALALVLFGCEKEVNTDSSLNNDINEGQVVNNAPVINSHSVLTGTVQENYSYTLTATDADENDVLVYSAETFPSWLTFDVDSQSLVGMPTQAGEYSVQLTVTDGTASTVQNFVITIPALIPEPTVPVEPNGAWQLVWSDEFSGDSLDETKWEYEVNCTGGGNNEQQCYTNSNENSFIDNGFLNIVAKAAPSDAILPYTSARLRTMNKGDWQYGRFEIRAQLPQGQGTWPAIWMLPTDWVYGGWAASGEIDIMEAVNLKVGGERNVHGTLHFGKAWPDNVHSGANYLLPNDASPADDFHIYTIEWQTDEIRWYVDGVHFSTQRSDGWYSQYTENGGLVTGEADAPFNQKFHLLLNLAVGGAWAGNVNDTGIDTSVFPQSMLVDYVRVYECAESPTTGAGCETIDESVQVVVGHTPPIPPDTSFGVGSVIDLYVDELHEKLVFASYNPDAEISYEEVTEADRGNVLAIAKTGATGNVFFEYGDRTDLTHWLAFGEIVFDLKVDSMANSTELLIKIDSGWPDVSDVSLAIPPLNEWTEVKINIAELIESGNSVADGMANIGDIVNVFVIEPNGVMDLKIDNIRFVKNASSLTSVNIFDDIEHAPYTLGSYSVSGDVVIEDIDSGDNNHGLVKQLTFNTNESVVYFQSETGIDVSSFVNVEFDLYVVTDPRVEQSFMVKVESFHPSTSGDFVIKTPVTGVWTSYVIPLADLVANTDSSLDLTNVNTPLVIFPEWGNQQGVVMQVDNVRLTK